MDYGDEANDGEERRYKREMFGSEDSEGEAGEEESQEIVPLAREFSKRGNRGQRMNMLVGKAQEDDDAFWGGVGNDFFGGGEEDD